MYRYFAQIDTNNIVTMSIIGTSVEDCTAQFGGELVETFMGIPDINFGVVGHTYDRANNNFHA